MSDLARETAVEAAVAAVGAGRPVILPTDTVYGLCAKADDAAAVRAAYRLKGREEGQPTALLAADLEVLLERVPELRGRPAALAGALLPGGYTLIFANPARRYRWLTGAASETIGVRVPEVTGAARLVLDRVGALAATSANLPGGPDPAKVVEVPEQIRAGCGAVLDGGTLPGTPSTVLDLTGQEPRVLREGAVPAAEALDRLRAVL
jgi:L-threonylcarbamoyladenylate synthase